MTTEEGFKLVPVQPTEEMVRSMLAVRWPATYRNALRFNGSGPATSAQAERDISEAEDQYRAMLAAAPASPQAAQPVEVIGYYVERGSSNHFRDSPAYGRGVKCTALVDLAHTTRLQSENYQLRAALAERDALIAREADSYQVHADDITIAKHNRDWYQARADELRRALSTAAKPEADHE